MAFRADEAAQEGLEEVLHYFCRIHGQTEEARARSKARVMDVVAACGPVVSTYPTWHPLVSHQSADDTETTPGSRCGYEGLDHTRYFAHGFITCPYGDGQEVIEAVEKLPSHPIATIRAERLDVELYAPGATPILVTCDWDRAIEPDGTIPLAVAVALLLDKEIPCWRWSQVAETWETMRPYFLGRPHGSRSSLFVSQETGQAMKKVWQTIINTGMYGNIKM